MSLRVLLSLAMALLAACNSAGGARAPVVGTAPNTVGTWVNITPPTYWALMQANNVYPSSGSYSMTGIGLSPSAPATLYASTVRGNGLFKSTDGGNSWAGPIGTTFLNVNGTTHTQGNPWTTGAGTSWTIAVDPLDANTVYAFSAFGGDQGPWKTTDGGNTWRGMFSSADNSAMTPDIYAIAVDPNNHQHLLITFHSPWNYTANAGILESVDGGATFIKHYPVAMGGAVPDSGAGHYAFFLGRKNDGTVDASGKFWIFATQGNGFWRTEDGGTTWTEVASGYNMQHGAGGLYRASTGVLYMGAVRHLLRSTDNGRTWTLAGEPPTGSGLDDFLHDGYNAVIGDGVTMFVMPANTGYHTNGAPTPYYYSSETDGTHWTQYGNQTFYDGPGWMAADAVNHVIYSSNWAAGLWRLETGH